MSNEIEAEVRRLLRELSKAAALSGGMDRATYDALVAASALMSGSALPDDQLARSVALSAARARLTACAMAQQLKAA